MTDIATLVLTLAGFLALHFAWSGTSATEISRTAPGTCNSTRIS